MQLFYENFKYFLLLCLYFLQNIYILRTTKLQRRIKFEQFLHISYAICTSENESENRFTVAFETARI